MMLTCSKHDRLVFYHRVLLLLYDFVWFIQALTYWYNYLSYDKYDDSKISLETV